MLFIYAFMKYFYLTCFFLVLFTNINAQDFDFGLNSFKDVDLKNCPFDPDANAVVIREFGTAQMYHDEIKGALAIDFIYHVKIKIFNKNGFDNGTVEVPLAVNGDNQENISDLKAVTINYVNGNFVRSELDPKKVINEKRHRYLNIIKFTMPNLSDGSIIEYSYRIKSPKIFNFRGWEFQSEIPKIHSEYIAQIPAMYNYNVVMRGPYKLTTQNAEVLKECLRISGVSIDCSKMTYIMKDVPAFVSEDYMTAASNFKSAIKFELSDYQTLSGAKMNVTKRWKDVDYELVSHNSFGSQMKRKDDFKDILPGILKNKTDNLEKAKAIYDYIAKNIRSNGYIGIYAESSAKKALESHSGNTGDINLALISALTAANLDAEAMILSTREFGTVNSLFPVLTDFNYVVAKLNIGDKTYLLDASVPLLPFGLLPIYCMNGQGRVINLKKPSYWYDLVASQKDYTSYSLIATLTKDGKLKGELNTFTSGYSALNRRKAITAANSIEEHVEKMEARMSNIKVDNYKVNNLDSLDLPLMETYEMEMDLFKGANISRFFFNPFIIDRIGKNPFNLDERTYPVDLGSTREIRTIIQIAIPENFTVSEQPKPLNVALPENGGRYQLITAFENQVISLNQVLSYNKPVYSPEEYLGLKELLSRIIQVQKTDIVLQKTK